LCPPPLPPAISRPRAFAVACDSASAAANAWDQRLGSKGFVGFGVGGGRRRGKRAWSWGSEEQRRWLRQTATADGGTGAGDGRSSSRNAAAEGKKGKRITCGFESINGRGG
jgi:hypothetical protein